MSPKNQERRFDPKYAGTLLKIVQRDFSTGQYAQGGADSGDVRRYEEGALIYEAEDLEDARTLTEELLRWGESVITRG